ncbi:MAG: Serine--tRNA ligase, partial [Planctomycetota bacterium]
MLDIKYIRANPDVVKAGAAKKRIALDLDAILSLDDKVRAGITEVDRLRAEQKNASKLIGAAAPADRPRLAEEQKAQKAALKEKEEDLARLQAEL